MTILLHWFDTFAPAQYGTAFQYQDSANIMRKAMADQIFEFSLLRQNDKPRGNANFSEVIGV